MDEIASNDQGHRSWMKSSTMGQGHGRWMKYRLQSWPQMTDVVVDNGQDPDNRRSHKWEMTLQTMTGPANDAGGCYHHDQSVELKHQPNPES